MTTGEDQGRSQQARDGDRLIYESQDGITVAYLQVTKVDAGDIVTDMWLWNKS